MAGELLKQEEVPNAPFIIIAAAADSALLAFLNSLSALGSGGSLSDIGSVAPERALWAAPLANSGGAPSGSAYVVSPETLTRVKARRY